MLTSTSSRWARIAATAGAAVAITVMAVTMTAGPAHAAADTRGASSRASAMDCPTYPNCGPVPAAAVDCPDPTNCIPPTALAVAVRAAAVRASVVCPDPKDCPIPGAAFDVIRRAASA